MRSFAIFFSIIFFLATACKTQKPAKSNAPILISYSKTPCFGSCGVFDLTIYQDGNAEINKKRFIEPVGQFKINIGKKEINQIKDIIAEIDACKMDSIYGANISDLPSTIITLKCEKSYKTVIAIMGYPKKLDILNRKMMDIVKLKEWEPVVFD